MKTMRLRRSADGQRLSHEGGLKDVLDAVDDRGPVQAFENVHEAFESQEIRARSAR